MSLQGNILWFLMGGLVLGLAWWLWGCAARAARANTFFWRWRWRAAVWSSVSVFSERAV